MKKRKKNFYKKNIKVLLLFGIIILCVIFAICILLNNNKYYKISSRVAELNKEIKNDDAAYRTIGWIQVQGTNIDYPVIQSKGEDSNYPVDKESYFWSRNSDNKMHNNMLINGHNIFNLSSQPKTKSVMFKRAEELMSFVYYDFSKKNKYIQLTIGNHDYIYKIFSVAFIDGSDATFLPYKDDLSSKEMNDYIDILKENSIYEYDVKVNSKDKIISVVTCNRIFSDRTKEELYVSGRLLRENEKNNNYGVKKSKNYKILEKVWEDSKDEEA